MKRRKLSLEVIVWHKICAVLVVGFVITTALLTGHLGEVVELIRPLLN